MTIIPEFVSSASDFFGESRHTGRHQYHPFLQLHSAVCQWQWMCQFCQLQHWEIKVVKCYKSCGMDVVHYSETRNIVSIGEVLTQTCNALMEAVYHQLFGGCGILKQLDFMQTFLALHYPQIMYSQLASNQPKQRSMSKQVEPQCFIDSFIIGRQSS